MFPDIMQEIKEFPSFNVTNVWNENIGIKDFESHAHVNTKYF